MTNSNTTVTTYLVRVRKLVTTSSSTTLVCYVVTSRWQPPTSDTNDFFILILAEFPVLWYWLMCWWPSFTKQHATNDLTFKLPKSLNCTRPRRGSNASRSFLISGGATRSQRSYLQPQVTWLFSMCRWWASTYCFSRLKCQVTWLDGPMHLVRSCFLATQMIIRVKKLLSYLTSETPRNIETNAITAYHPQGGNRYVATYH